MTLLLIPNNFVGSEDHNKDGSFGGTADYTRGTQCHAVRHGFALRPSPAATAALMRQRAAHVEQLHPTEDEWDRASVGSKTGLMNLISFGEAEAFVMRPSRAAWCTLSTPSHRG